MEAKGKFIGSLGKKLLMPKWLGGLGFRDLHLFNQALLARQTWRLIQFLDSLCAILLKAKYYPRGNIFGAHIKSDSSI
jgi:hypothetical protein